MNEGDSGRHAPVFPATQIHQPSHLTQISLTVTTAQASDRAHARAVGSGVPVGSVSPKHHDDASSDGDAAAPADHLIGLRVAQ